MATWIFANPQNVRKRSAVATREMATQKATQFSVRETTVRSAMVAAGPIPARRAPMIAPASPNSEPTTARYELALASAAAMSLHFKMISFLASTIAESAARHATLSQSRNFGSGTPPGPVGTLMISPLSGWRERAGRASVPSGKLPIESHALQLLGD